MKLPSKPKQQTKSIVVRDLNDRIAKQLIDERPLPNQTFFCSTGENINMQRTFYNKPKDIIFFKTTKSKDRYPTKKFTKSVGHHYFKAQVERDHAINNIRFKKRSVHNNGQSKTFDNFDFHANKSALDNSHLLQKSGDEKNPAKVLSSDILFKREHKTLENRKKFIREIDDNVRQQISMYDFKDQQFDPFNTKTDSIRESNSRVKDFKMKTTVSHFKNPNQNFKDSIVENSLPSVTDEIDNTGLSSSNMNNGSGITNKYYSKIKNTNENLDSSLNEFVMYDYTSGRENLINKSNFVRNINSPDQYYGRPKKDTKFLEDKFSNILDNSNVQSILKQNSSNEETLLRNEKTNSNINRFKTKNKQKNYNMTSGQFIEDNKLTNIDNTSLNISYGSQGSSMKKRSYNPLNDVENSSGGRSYTSKDKVTWNKYFGTYKKIEQKIETDKENDWNLGEAWTIFHKHEKGILNENQIQFDSNPQHECNMLKKFFIEITERYNSEVADYDHKNQNNFVKNYNELYCFVNTLFVKRLNKECSGFALQLREITTRTQDFIKYIFGKMKTKEIQVNNLNTTLLAELTKDKEENKVKELLKQSYKKLNLPFKDVKEENYEEQISALSEKIRYHKKKIKDLLQSETKYMQKINAQAFKLAELKNMYLGTCTAYENMKQVACGAIEKGLFHAIKTKDRENIQEFSEQIKKEKLDFNVSYDQITKWIDRDDEYFHIMDFLDINKVIASDESHETLSDENEATLEKKVNLKIYIGEEHKKTMARNYVSKKPVKLWKSPSFVLDCKNRTLLNPLAMKVEDRDQVTDTNDLMDFSDGATQTKVSLVNRVYDEIFQSQNKFTNWYKRSEFQQNLLNLTKERKQLHMIKDPKMRMMLVNVYKAREEKNSTDELENDYGSSRRTNGIINARPSRKFSTLEPMTAGHLNKNDIVSELNGQLEAHEQIEELIDSYAFESNKVMDLTNKLTEKDKNFTVLIEVTRTLKQKLKDYDKEMGGYKDRFEQYMKMHKNCNVTKEMGYLQKRKYGTAQALKSNDVITQKKQYIAPITKNGKGVVVSDNPDIKKEKKLEKEIKRKIETEKQAKQSEEKIDELIERIKIFYQLKSNNVEIKQIPIKSLYKLISQIYQDKIGAHHVNPNLINISIRSYADKHFNEIYGESPVSSKKLRELLISGFYYKNNQRVLFFDRFMRLIDDIRYTQYEEQMYQTGMDYLMSSNKGMSIAVNYEEGNHYFPICRVRDYINSHLKKKMPNNYLIILKKEINNRKIYDSSRENPDGIIDFDQLMSCIFGVRRMCLAGEITYLRAIFRACDLNDDTTVEFDEIQIFFKRIEKISEKNSLKLLKENFEIYADSYKSKVPEKPVPVKAKISKSQDPKSKKTPANNNKVSNRSDRTTNKAEGYLTGSRIAMAKMMKREKKKKRDSYKPEDDAPSKALNIDQFVMFCSEGRLFTKEKVHSFLGINDGDDVIYHFLEKKELINSNYADIHNSISNIKSKSHFWKNKWMFLLGKFLL